MKLEVECISSFTEFCLDLKDARATVMLRNSAVDGVAANKDGQIKTLLTSFFSRDLHPERRLSP